MEENCSRDEMLTVVRSETNVDVPKCPAATQNAAGEAGTMCNRTRGVGMTLRWRAGDIVKIESSQSKENCGGAQNR